MKIILAFFLLWCGLSSAQSLDQLKKEANAHYQINEYYSAIPLYRKILREEKENDHARYLLFLCYLKINNLESALPLANELTSRNNPQTLNTWKELSGYYLNRNMHEAALESLHKGLASYPNDPGLTDKLLFLYETTENWSDALDLLDSPVLSQNPENPKRRIRYLIALNRTEEADRLIRDRLESDPQNIVWLGLQAYFYRQTGALQKAEKIYMSLYQKTRLMIHIKECAAMYSQNGQNSEALRVVRTLHNTENPGTYRLSAGILTDLALYPEALTLYSEMKRIFPGQNIYQELFNLYELTSQYKELTEEYVRYAKATGDQNRAIQGITEISLLPGHLEQITNILIRIESSASSPPDKNLVLKILYKVQVQNGLYASASASARSIASLGKEPDFMVRAGQEFMYLKEYSSAGYLLEEYIKNRPSGLMTGLAVRLLASIRFHEGKHSESLALLNQMDLNGITEQESTDHAVWKAKNLLALNRATEALDILLSQRKKTPESRLILAMVRYRTGDPEGAFKEADPVLSDPVYGGEAGLFSSYLLMLQGKTEEAKTRMEKAVLVHPTDDHIPSLIFELFIIRNFFSGSTNGLSTYVQSRLLYYFQDYSSCESLLSELEKKFKEKKYIFSYLRANVRFASDHPDEAFILFEKVTGYKDLPSFFYASSLESMASIRYTEKRFSEALDLYRKILTTYPDYVRSSRVRERILELKNR